MHSVLSMKTREAPTALQTETGDRQWLFRVILTLGTLSEVAYLPYVVFTVFGLLVDYVTRHSS